MTLIFKKQRRKRGRKSLFNLKTTPHFAYTNAAATADDDDAQCVCLILIIQCQ